MKLVMVDLDGTLFDTKKVNYYAYKKAANTFGYDIDYEYYCKYCNGKHYLEFLPQITTEDRSILSKMHQIKKESYKSFLKYARPNKSLIDLLYIIKKNYKIALITTASRSNTMEILHEFRIEKLFDLILTQEDISKTKPDPEGYLKAMEYFSVIPAECVIYEDSIVGIEAAEKSGANVFIVKGFN